MKSISLDATIIITERSKRTWWRRLSESAVTRMGCDARGRATLAFDEIIPFISIPVEVDDLDLILMADRGDADAQNDVGQMFAAAEKIDAALYWLRAAADQGHSDAMQNLGSIYMAGKGVPRDENLGIMWIAKAASCGHVIANFQIKSLRPFPKNKSNTY